MSGLNDVPYWQGGAVANNTIPASDPSTLPPAPPPPLPPPTPAALPADVRAMFPEIAPELVSDASLTVWLNTAAVRLDPVRWSTLLPLGTILFAAHNVMLSAQRSAAAARAAAMGGAAAFPGLASGVVTSKSAGGVSKSIDPRFGAAGDDAGTYNLTTYGAQFWELAQIVGAGGMQL